MPIRLLMEDRDKETEWHARPQTVMSLSIATSIIDPYDIDTTVENIGGLEQAKDGIFQNATIPFQS